MLSDGPVNRSPPAESAQYSGNRIHVLLSYPRKLQIFSDAIVWYLHTILHDIVSHPHWNHPISPESGGVLRGQINQH